MLPSQLPKILILLFILTNVFSCYQNQKPQIIDFKKLNLKVSDTNENHVLFKGQTTINGIGFEVFNEVKYKDLGEDLKLVHRKDTLLIHLDESFQKSYIWDVNKDHEPDLNFIYRMTNNTYINYVFLYDRTSKKYSQVPDTFFYEDLDFLK
ncbi:MAG: hypothetical protein RL762_1120 [Bacteroidota bacterium]|jgi:hypothetical protein